MAIPGLQVDNDCSVNLPLAEEVMMLTRGQVLQWSVVALLGVAVVFVNSAAMGVGEHQSITLKHLLLGRPTIYALLAFLAMWFVGHVDLRRLYQVRGFVNPIPWLLLASMVLCVVALLPGVGVSINASSRWLHLGPARYGLTFQPSELAKWTMVLATAWWCARRSGAMRRFFIGLMPALLVTAVVCGLIVIEDLGTAALIGVVAIGLCIAGGARLWQVGLVIPAGLAGFVMMIIHSPYRMQRLLTFLDPYADPRGAGYQPIQMLAAIVESNRGLGNGIAKMGYLPADQTDAIFAVIVEEIGVAGAALVIGVYLVMLWAMLGVVRESRWPFGRLLGVGVLLTIGLQAVINLAVVTVVVPTKGIALPLVSTGGTGWVMCAAAIGAVVALDRINELERQRPTVSVIEPRLLTSPPPALIA